MIKDTPLKDRVYRHLRAQGQYVLAEVVVFHRGGFDEHRKVITDVDVFGIRASPDLRWEYVVGDCKTKKSESPANRVLWVHAVMQQCEAVRGLLVLRKGIIEPDHKLLATSLNIGLIDEAEFDAYDRAIVFPSGSAQFGEGVEDYQRLREVALRFPRLTALSQYISGPAWSETDHMTMLRRMLATGHEIRNEIDPSRLDHMALMLEAAGVMAVALATCVGTIFHQYLQPNAQQDLDQALKVLLWGGRERYEWTETLRRRLLEAKGHDSSGPLTVPDWTGFLHLVRSCLDAPRLAFGIPQVLRAAALDILYSRPFLQAYTRNDNLLLKLSMIAATYYLKAIGAPSDSYAAVRNAFANRMSELAVSVPESRDIAAVAPRATNLSEVGPLSVGATPDASRMVNTEGISREGAPDQSNLPGFAKFNEAVSDREPSKPRPRSAPGRRPNR